MQVHASAPAAVMTVQAHLLSVWMPDERRLSESVLDVGSGDSRFKPQSCIVTQVIPAQIPQSPRAAEMLCQQHSTSELHICGLRGSQQKKAEPPGRVGRAGSGRVGVK